MGRSPIIDDQMKKSIIDTIKPPQSSFIDVETSQIIVHRCGSQVMIRFAVLCVVVQSGRAFRGVCPSVSSDRQGHVAHGPAVRVVVNPHIQLTAEKIVLSLSNGPLRGSCSPFQQPHVRPTGDLRRDQGLTVRRPRQAAIVAKVLGDADPLVVVGNCPGRARSHVEGLQLGSLRAPRGLPGRTA
jgi:hypothetical protein